LDWVEIRRNFASENLNNKLNNKKNKVMMYNNNLANELPAAVKAFVEESFPMQSIAFIEEENSISGTGLLICLNNGTELGFNASGSCISIHSWGGY
jgi:hypothetical protein